MVTTCAVVERGRKTLSNTRTNGWKKSATPPIAPPRLPSKSPKFGNMARSTPRGPRSSAAISPGRCGSKFGVNAEMSRQRGIRRPSLPGVCRRGTATEKRTRNCSKNSHSSNSKCAKWPDFIAESNLKLAGTNHPFPNSGNSIAILAALYEGLAAASRSARSTHPAAVP